VLAWTPQIPERDFRQCALDAINALKESGQEIGDYLEFGVSRGTSYACMYHVLRHAGVNEARLIGERYRDGIPVIMNLTEMDDAGAKRLVDFAAGLAFALRGSIEKGTNRVFLLSPPNVEVSASDRRKLAEKNYASTS